MSQSDFRTALLDPDRPAPGGLTDPQGRPAGRRFDVYRNNVTVSLTEALEQTFPALRKLVGEVFFAAMAREHIRAHPPASPILRLYGSEMPGFLKRFQPVAHLAYLPDIARLELALVAAYHAADAEPVGDETMRSLTPDAFLSARLTFAPSVRLVRSRWPIHAIWSANMAGGGAPTVQRAEDVLIVRPEFDAEPLLLPDNAAPFLAGLMSGMTVSEAFDAAGAFDLTALLGQLLTARAIAEICHGDPE
ncbi:MAG: putative DNA-binding domain-containing protein [Rhodobacteraceae bacterium]|nr:putative DNA-binding domain-containing protein [Paracoccaceae bacterium]